MKQVTVDQVMVWKPCGENDGQTRQRVKILFDGRDVLTATDVVTLDIPAGDKIWALLHDEFLDDEQMYSLACDFAERVLYLANGDLHAKAMIDTRRAWLCNEVGDHELAIAWDAAWAAWNTTWDIAGDEDAIWIAREAVRASWVIFWTTARDAAWNAAKAATRATARAAAIDAARATGKDIAWVTAWETIWETAWETAKITEQQWQIERVMERIKTDAD